MLLVFHVSGIIQRDCDNKDIELNKIVFSQLLQLQKVIHNQSSSIESSRFWWNSSFIGLIMRKLRVQLEMWGKMWASSIANVTFSRKLISIKMLKLVFFWSPLLIIVMHQFSHSNSTYTAMDTFWLGIVSPSWPTLYWLDWIWFDDKFNIFLKQSSAVFCYDCWKDLFTVITLVAFGLPRRYSRPMTQFQTKTSSKTLISHRKLDSDWMYLSIFVFIHENYRHLSEF